ncbi:MAG: hypothetical protein A2V88_11825 [Elusimicrobia bacterium RBG_16_66_12]|nr:MAG: hypothetical protein A2V88_11825 [Elusimicrobia bacterium RBG_16_66_12]
MIMTTLMNYDTPGRKMLAAVIGQALTPDQLTMAHHLMAAEKPGRPAPRPEDVLFWLRLNMPSAAERIDELLHPAE